MCDAFVPLIDASCGRIVITSSELGPDYVGKLDKDHQKFFTRADVTWESLEEYLAQNIGSVEGTWPTYGFSKAAVNSYAMVLANKYPNILTSAFNPGFTATSLTAGMGATRTPEEGCQSARLCLLNKLDGNGWFYGSDGLRSPLHCAREPGSPAFQGY